MAGASDPRDALLASDAALEAISDEGIRKSHAYTGIRSNLTVNLRIMPDAALLLKNIVEEVRARRAAADAHFQRRE